MTDETGEPQGTRRSSDALFFVAVALVMLVVIGGGIYLLRPASDGDAVSSTPPSTGPTVPQASPASPSTSPSTSPTTSTTPDAQHAEGAAGALAVVEKAFRLSEAGQYDASCALESPAYLKFDAGHYPHGSCAAQQRADTAAFAAQGLSLHLTSAEVVASTKDTATVVAEVTLGSRVVSEHIYLRHHAGHWWMTGADDSGGDLGY